MKKKEKIGCVSFPPKAITVYSREKKGFDCNNNHRCGKSANFWPNNISKINYKMLVILLYTLLGLGSRKFQLIWRLFKYSTPLLCSW